MQQRIWYIDINRADCDTFKVLVLVTCHAYVLELATAASISFAFLYT
jgi:hypothetical protein